MFKNLFSITEEQKGTRTYNVVRILGLKLKKRIRGNNRIYLIKNGQRKEVKRVKGIEFVFNGANTVVEIGSEPMAKFRNCIITCEDSAVVNIGSSKHIIENLNMRILGQGSKIIIGNDFSIGSGVFYNPEPDKEIRIGDDCMFSYNIRISTTDSHTIYDKKTKKVLNYPCDVNIADHVWCTRNVRILKGANIPDEFIVGTNSLVTRNSVKPEKACISGGVLVGIPAKVIKTDCTWSRKCTSDFEKENM